MTDRELVELALQARANAYAPYSKFHVGAALLARDGRVFTGVNVENGSYGATCCAERVALYAAVAAGARDFLAIAVASDSSKVTTPCGICRQALHEFAPGLRVIMAAHDERYEVKVLEELLPGAFEFAAAAARENE